MTLNKIKIPPYSETVYVVLDRFTGDFQQVDSTIGHALEANLATIKFTRGAIKASVNRVNDANDEARIEIARFLRRTNVTVILAGFSC